MAHIKLSNIVYEIKREYKSSTKKIVQETTSRSLSLFAIEDVLNSGALTLHESLALHEFFKFRKSTPFLNENTIRLINKELLREGILDWIKDKGSKFASALKGGWEKIKKAWSNFKDFILGIVQQLKEAMKKAFDEIVSKFKSAMDFGQKIADKLSEMITDKQDQAINNLMKKVIQNSGKSDIKESANVNELNQEVVTLKKTGAHFYTFIKSNFIELETLEKNAISGKGAEDESVQSESISNKLFQNKRLVETLINLNESGLAHPEDLLKKYPILHKIVKVFITIFKYTFGIFSTLIKKIGEKISGSILDIVNFTSRWVQGPVSETNYALLSALIGELFEIVGHSISGVEELVKDGISAALSIIQLIVPVLALHIEILKTVFEVAVTFFYIHAIITVLFTVVVPKVKELLAYLDKNPSTFSNLTTMSVK